jgi:crotonobetainyl-CoA:carnitine CoA-transferase CaiB-like acyl-CoA transferase
VTGTAPSDVGHSAWSGTGEPVQLCVLDVGTIIGGPFVATLLGDLGADVIKCEQPGSGDPVRLADGLSARWQVEARNKRSITLNLRVPEGQALLRDLCQRADVLVENFRPGTMAKWGLGYDDLREVNPRLVYVSVSGYGQTGPYRDRPGYDPVVAAFGGLTDMSGLPDGPPMRPGLSVIDHMSALFATVGALEALRRRDGPGGTGTGAWIDHALYESSLRIAGVHFAAHSLAGEVPTRAGVLPYRTADDRWFVIHADSNREFGRLRSVIEDPQLDDPRFATREGRVANAEDLTALIGKWVQRQSARDVLDMLVAADVPASLVNNVADLGADPHVAEREDLITIENARQQAVTMPGVFPRIVGQDTPVRWAGQELGASNESVYLDLLGLSRDAYDALRTNGVI